MTTSQPMFRALRLLEHVAPPSLYGRPPYWRAPVAPPSKPGVVLVPSWNWKRFEPAEVPEGERAITCDINGAFLAASGSVEVAYSQLHNAGRLNPVDMDPRHVWPGYYKVTVPYWPFDATLVSPLGDSPRLAVEKHVWVAHPTLVLLLELFQEGSVGDLEIHEGWVAEKRCNFRAWNAKLKEVRNALLDERDAATTDEQREHFKARYEAFKEGYGAAFSMMLTGNGCKAHRPDWSHAVYAQHAATAWRKAWRLSAIGPVLSMGDTDEITVLHSDLQRAITAPKPPVKWDDSGRLLGHLKEKKKEPAPAEQEYADAATGRAADFFNQDFGVDE